MLGHVGKGWLCAWQENGCLQVVPGSHTRDFEHLPGSGLHAQGEWATPGKTCKERPKLDRVQFPCSTCLPM